MASEGYLQLVEDVRSETKKLIETDEHRLHLLLSFEKRRELIASFIKTMRRLIHSWKKDLEAGAVGSVKQESIKQINIVADPKTRALLLEIHNLYETIQGMYTVPATGETEAKIKKFLDLTNHLDGLDAKTAKRIEEESRILKEELEIIHSSTNMENLFYELFGHEDNNGKGREGLLLQWTRLEYRIIEHIHNQLSRARQSFQLNKKFSATELTSFIENLEDSLEKLEHTVVIEDHKLRPIRSFLTQQGKTLRALDERLGQRTGWFSWIFSAGKKKELTWEDVKADVTSLGYTDPGDFSEYLTALQNQLSHYKISKKDRHKIEMYIKLGQSLARKARKQRTTDFVAREQELMKYLEERKIDLLTGLLDFRSYREHLSRHIVKTEMGQEDDFCYIFFDIDRFKWFNDAYNHQIGDEVLQLVASMLLSETRSHYKLEEKREPDVVFRIGGEEIVLLLPGASLKEGEVVANRNREKVQEESMAPLKEINRRYLATKVWYDKILGILGHLADDSPAKHTVRKTVSEYLDKIRAEPDVDKKIAMIQKEPMLTTSMKSYTLGEYLKEMLEGENLDEEINKYIGGIRKSITLSGGVISYKVARPIIEHLLPKGNFTTDDLQKKTDEIGEKLKSIADAGLYKSKESGRNKITAVYRPQNFAEKEEEESLIN